MATARRSGPALSTSINNIALAVIFASRRAPESRRASRTIHLWVGSSVGIGCLQYLPRRGRVVLASAGDLPSDQFPGIGFGLFLPPKLLAAGAASPASSPRGSGRAPRSVPRSGGRRDESRGRARAPWMPARLKQAASAGADRKLGMWLGAGSIAFLGSLCVCERGVGRPCRRSGSRLAIWPYAALD